ncbi:MAG: 1-acyl-sn-glycerol-3-phosphate acyltransferase [Cytophagales bacterium]|nr:1-acyl-sn-glycerol-3-phosphate acyltransferase [Cytophagales bacterium]
MLRPFYLLLFKIFGWKINGAMPVGMKKYIIAVGPHTSNWDFPVGLAARSILRIQDAQFLGKSELFVPPFGWIFRALGGHPVDRKSSHDVVEQVVQIFERHEKFILGLAPEGTRKKVDKLRTGFYFIAKGAGVPIVPVGFDFKRKEIVVGAPLYPKEVGKDMETILAFYKTIHARNPELALG